MKMFAEPAWQVQSAGVHETQCRLTGYPGTLRERIVIRLGPHAATVIVTDNDNRQLERTSSTTAA